MYIEDDLGNYGCGEYFNVAIAGIEIITVTEPDTSTIWNNTEMNRSISWIYPAVLGLHRQMSGDSVSITLYKGTAFVDTLISSTLNTGTWIFSDSLPDSWVSDIDYKVHIEDDLGYYGWSEYFEIQNNTGMSYPESLDQLQLFPIVPNPSTSGFAISYYIPIASEAMVVIYDLSGKLVAELATGEHRPGLHQLQVNCIPTGMFFCRLHVGSEIFTEKFVVIR